MQTKESRVFARVIPVRTLAKCHSRQTKDFRVSLTNALELGGFRHIELCTVLDDTHGLVHGGLCWVEGGGDCCGTPRTEDTLRREHPERRSNLDRKRCLQLTANKKVCYTALFLYLQLGL